MYITLQSNNNVFLSLLITFIILTMLGLLYVLIRYRTKVKDRAVVIERALGNPVSILLFTIIRVLIGLIGIGVLIATLLPGLMPFRAYVNQNLELGGLVFFFIWPLLTVQVVAAFIPYKKQWIKASPFLAWFILLMAGYMAIRLDFIAINMMYDFTM